MTIPDARVTAVDRSTPLSADVRRRLTNGDPERRLIRHFDRYSQLSWPSQVMRLDVETYLPEDILTAVDRMSMAHSIEARAAAQQPGDRLHIAAPGDAQNTRRLPETCSEGSGSRVPTERTPRPT